MYENGLLPEKMDEELLAKAVREASAPADGAPQNSGLSAAPSEDVTEFDFGSFRFFLGNLIDNYALQEEVGPASYDIVVANILPDVLVPLTPAAVRALKPGGIYITSGILEGREESVVEAMLDAGLEILSITAQGEWRSVTGMLL
ncbi:MAG: 50S ribosomal protein L11 methyltransferase [Lachnospiraceae bacterium]|nr:50S ribosomal protein L11 methyltransferase [Lachnospiraceae bacterium]